MPFAKRYGLTYCLAALLLALGASAEAQDKNKGPQAIKPPVKPRAVEPVEVKISNAQEKTNPKVEKDDAEAREEWFVEWFGPIAPGYLNYKQNLAEQEIQKWGSKIPGTPMYRARIKNTHASDGAGLPSSVFRNIGPFHEVAQLQQNANDPNIIDTGRITIILPHPTNPRLLYVGYAGGGLWRCKNADLASNEDWVWESLTDGLPGGSAAGNISIGSAAFKPEDPNTIYLSLGDMMPGSANSTAEGRGFFISKDGGDTWTRGGSLGDTSRTKTILALPGNIVLVAGNTGIYRSTDGGLNFQRYRAVQLPPPYESYNAVYAGWDMLRLDNGDLVASVSYTRYNVGGGVVYPTENGDILYSTDNGATWTKAVRNTPFPASDIRRMSIAANGRTLYCLFQDVSQNTFRKGLLKSTDYGRTWSYQEAPTLFSYFDPIWNSNTDGGQTSYNQMIAVDPDNADTVFLGTNMCSWRSTNGGLTFECMTHWIASGRQYMHADMHVSAWSKSGPKALYNGTDGGLSILRQPNITPIPSSSTRMVSDPAIIDHRRNKNIATHLIYNIASTTAETPSGSRSRVLAGFQDLGTRLRRESGVATGTFNEVIGGDGFGCLIHAYNGDLMLGSLYYTQIRRSSNGGISFVNSANGITNGSGNAPFYTRLFDTPADPTGNRVYTFNNTTPYVSDDFGVSWFPLPTSGNGWPGGNIRSFGASPMKLGLVGATFDVSADGRVGRIAISEDNGDHWRTYTGFPGATSTGGMAEISFDVSDQNIIYVTSVVLNQTANHLWKSTDRGYTWRAIDGASSNPNGFPFGVPVHVLKIDPLDNNVLYAGTDLGLYRSTNQGTTWARFGDGLPLVSVRDIYIAPDGSFVRVGTHGRGIWEMTGVTNEYAPRIIAQPHSSPTMAAAVGVRVNLAVSAVGLPAPTYQWQHSTDNGATWTNIPGATEKFYSFTPYAADKGRQYRALAANSKGAATSNPVAIDLNPYDIDGVLGLDVYDLLKFMAMFGSTKPEDIMYADFNGDGKIDDADLALILGAF